MSQPLFDQSEADRLLDEFLAMLPAFPTTIGVFSAEGGIAEVVLATNPTTTGEATALHIAELLRDRVTITRLASGLPVGADLEHADEVTLGKAFAGRRSLD